MNTHKSKLLARIKETEVDRVDRKGGSFMLWSPTILSSLVQRHAGQVLLVCVCVQNIGSFGSSSKVQELVSKIVQYFTSTSSGQKRYILSSNREWNMCRLSTAICKAGISLQISSYFVSFQRLTYIIKISPGIFDLILPHNGVWIFY